MGTNEVDIIKTTDRNGNVLAVQGNLRLYAGQEYAQEYAQARTVIVKGLSAAAVWSFEGGRLRVLVHRNSLPGAIEPADIVKGIEDALEIAWGQCVALTTLEHQLANIARHHPNLVGPTPELLHRIDEIERDATRALGYSDERVRTHEADEHGDAVKQDELEPHADPTTFRIPAGEPDAIDGAGGNIGPDTSPDSQGMDPR